MCHHRRDVPEGGLLVSETGDRGARLGIGDCRRNELGEVCEPRLRVFGEPLVPQRENHHRPPQTSLDHDRARDGRAQARGTSDSSGAFVPKVDFVCGAGFLDGAAGLAGSTP